MNFMLYVRHIIHSTVNSEIFADAVKRHICDPQTSRLRHDLHVSVNDGVNLLFREGLFSRNFAYAKFRENKTIAKIFESTVSMKSFLLVFEDIIIVLMLSFSTIAEI